MHIEICIMTLGTLYDCKGKESALKLRDVLLPERVWVLYEEDVTAELQVLKIL